MQTATSTSFMYSLAPKLIKPMDFNILVMRIVPPGFSNANYINENFQFLLLVIEPLCTTT